MFARLTQTDGENFASKTRFRTKFRHGRPDQAKITSLREWIRIVVEKTYSFTRVFCPDKKYYLSAKVCVCLRLIYYRG